MKIRIRGNSIRIRLSKSEVALLAKDNYVEERTDFGNNTLTYAVRSTNGENMSANFIDGTITMMVPERLVQQWATTDLVSLDYNMPVNNNENLYILLEKDFQCIDAVVNEDQSDYFENPSKSC
jgi:hypothetical protein